MATKNPQKPKQSKAAPKAAPAKGARRQPPKERVVEEGKPEGGGRQRTREDFGGTPIGSDPRE